MTGNKNKTIISMVELSFVLNPGSHPSKVENGILGMNGLIDFNVSLNQIYLTLD